MSVKLDYTPLPPNPKTYADAHRDTETFTLNLAHHLTQQLLW